MDLLAAVAHRRSGILTYGITPPKASWSSERIQQVAARQTERIARLGVDGVVVYDLQDESARTDAERPYPYEESVDSVAYAYDHLVGVPVTKIVYRCVAELPPERLRADLDRIAEEGGATVLVGQASRNQRTRMQLADAYALRRRAQPELATGGVIIGERHRRGHREHERVLAKTTNGCSFFVSQAVYSTTDTKDVLSDLRRAREEAGQPVPPVLVTLTPCGSERTLTFLKWLGIAVPRWLENELLLAGSMLAASVDLCGQVFEDLWEYARKRDISLGCNVESVSLGRDEIEASVELVDRVRHIMGRPTR